MSSILLDTHTFIWLSEDDPNLPVSTRDMIEEIPFEHITPDHKANWINLTDNDNEGFLGAIAPRGCSVFSGEFIL